jgi:hypothetical protein
MKIKLGVAQKYPQHLMIFDASKASFNEDIAKHTKLTVEQVEQLRSEKD